MHIGKSLAVHLLAGSVKIFSGQYPEPDVLRNPRAGFHSLEPGPSAVSHLEFAEFLYCLVADVADIHHVEQGGNHHLLVFLALGFKNPRRFAQEYCLQFLIFLQVAQQGFLVLSALLPGLVNALDLWLGVGDLACQDVCVQGVGPADCAVVIRLGQRWQRLDCVPCRIAGKLDGQGLLCRRRAMVVEQAFQGELLLLLASYRKGYAFNNPYLVAENCQGVLLTV